jgi:aminoglycoside/choline kinase family phosphotransferase
MSEREMVLQQWLKKSCELSEFSFESMVNDASFRRYFRIKHAGGSYVAMEASDEREKCLPFIAIANALRAQGLLTPKIIASDLAQGFLLISDFGNKVLLKELNNHNTEILYTDALRELATIQNCSAVSGWTLPIFTAQFMRQELEWFKEWFLQKHLGLFLSSSTEKALNNCFDFLVEMIANQPYVFMHRDYHSANLMVLPNNRIGILDFQDAFIGPVTYDLVSLLRDCYHALPEALVTRLALQYRDQLQLSISNEEFLRWFDLTGLQRHLKALLTFARKYRRDDNANYLQHIPRTVNYIVTVGEHYSECETLCALMNETIPAALNISLT